MAAQPPSAGEQCAWSIARGTLIGSTLGAGFHFIGGGYVKSKGRTTLSQQHIAAEAGKAAFRLGGVFGMYTAVRCTLLYASGGSDAIACGTAGALAVMAPVLAEPGRLNFLREYYGESLDQLLSKGGKARPKMYGKPKPPPAPASLVLAVSALSGAIVIGAPDMLVHRMLGLRW